VTVAGASQAAAAPSSGPASLVGLTQTQVRSELGAPSFIQNDIWSFDSRIGTLSVTFKNGVVSQVSPRDFDLGILKAKTPAEVAVYVEAAREERKRLEAEPLVRVTNAQALVIARQAAAVAENRVADFDTAFLTAAQKLAPEFTGPQSLSHSDGLSILISGPLGHFFAAARDRVRRFEPLTPAPAWRLEIDITIYPGQIDAPDIEKVIVQRNGVIVPPLRTALVAREMVTRMGAKTMIHSGSVAYPISAFQPGAGVIVTVIAIPASGPNITRTFGSQELRALQ
jgi:hypothetical protein